MKYIKKYEDNTIYKPGDMIKVINPKIIFPYMKVISKQFPKSEILDGRFGDNKKKVSVEYIRLDLNQIDEGRVNVEDILGFCTEEEIEEYELKKGQIKFNI